MSEFKYRLAVAKDVNGLGIGVEKIEKGKGKIDDVLYIASIYAPGEFSNRAAVKTALDEVMALTDDEIITVQQCSDNVIFHCWVGVRRRFPRIKLVNSKYKFASVNELAMDALERKCTIKENLK